MNMTPKVAIIMGSTSDQSKMEKATSMLEDLGISYRVDVYSAHRTPDELSALVKDIDELDNFKVIIAGAGMSAALPGVIAAKTTKPVIGVPLSGTTVNDMAALLSISQMPPGIPVLGVGIDAAKNAALAAASIISLSDPDVAKKLSDFRKSQSDAVLNAEVSFEKENFRCK